MARAAALTQIKSAALKLFRWANSPVRVCSRGSRSSAESSWVVAPVPAAPAAHSACFSGQLDIKTRHDSRCAGSGALRICAGPLQLLQDGVRSMRSVWMVCWGLAGCHPQPAAGHFVPSAHDCSLTTSKFGDKQVSLIYIGSHSWRAWRTLKSPMRPCLRRCRLLLDRWKHSRVPAIRMPPTAAQGQSGEKLTACCSEQLLRQASAHLRRRRPTSRSGHPAPRGKQLSEQLLKQLLSTLRVWCAIDLLLPPA